ncbi:MAG: hypothetical protein IJR43_04615 [Synergistaceae bacterium]|nr:hypothetical protein [Synergistaceae bacterium]
MFRNSVTKQTKLRKRLFWLFQSDAIEGQLDYLVRFALRASKDFSNAVKKVNS